MSWFAEQAPPKDPPTEPRATQSHAAPAGGPSVAHQESSGHEEAPAGACFVCDHASGGGLRAAPGGGQACAEHAADGPHTRSQRCAERRTERRPRARASRHVACLRSPPARGGGRSAAWQSARRRQGGRIRRAPTQARAAHCSRASSQAALLRARASETAAAGPERCCRPGPRADERRARAGGRGCEEAAARSEG